MIEYKKFSKTNCAGKTLIDYIIEGPILEKKMESRYGKKERRN
jgi:hypothetical protein